MTLREGFAQTVIWGEGVWPNYHITFIVAKTSLIYSLFCSTYGICGGRGWFKTSNGEGGGWLKTSEYRHVGGKRV